MDFTRPVSQSKSNRTKRPLWFRIVVFFVGAISVVLLILLFLPQILSTEVCRNLVVAKINETIAPSTLKVQDWKLSWWSSQTFDELEFSGDSSVGNFKIKQIQMAGLLQILPPGIIKAHIFVDSPTIVLPEIAATEDVEKPVATTSPVDAKPDVSPFVLPYDVSLDFAVKNLTVKSAVSETIVSEMDISAKMANVNENLTLKIESPEISSVATFDVNALLDKKIFYIVKTFKINAKTNFGKISSLLKQKPLLSGEIAADVNYEIMSDGMISLLTNISTSKSLLLAEKSPVSFVSEVKFDVKGHISNPAEFTIRQAKIDLPGFQFSGSGSLQNADLNLKIDYEKILECLAVVKSDLPKITGFFTAELNKSDEILTFKALHTDDKISASVNGKANAWLSDKHLPMITEVSTDLMISDAVNANLKIDRINFETFSPKVEGASFTSETNLAKVKTIVDSIDSNLLKEFKNFAGILYFNAALSDLLPNRQPTVKLVTSLQKADIATSTIHAEGNELLRGEGQLEKGVLKLNLKTAIDKLQRGNDIAAGTVVTELEVAGVDGLTFSSSSSDFSFTTSGDTIPLPFSVTIPALKLRKTDLLFKNNVIATPYLKLEFDGVLSDFANKKELILKGRSSIDFDEIFKVIPALAANRDTFSVSGNETRDFALQSELSGDPLISAVARGEIAFTKMLVPGLEIGAGSCSWQLKNGLLNLGVLVPVNNGKFSLSPTINLAVTPISVFLPENSQILDDVNLTQKMLDTGFKKISPFLAGNIKPKGAISLSAANFNVLLDEAPLKNLSANIAVTMKGCEIVPESSILQHLSAYKNRLTYLTFQEEPIRISIENGVAVFDGFEIIMGKQQGFAVDGKVNLVTKAIDGKAIATLNDKKYTIPIKGTTDNPDFNILAAIGTKKISNKLTKKLNKYVPQEKQLDGEVADKLLKAIQGILD